MEPQLDKEQEARVDGTQEPINYHDLTFDATLPLANQLSSTRPDGLPAAEPLDLTHYVSPFTWPASRKNTIMFLSCITSIFICYAAGSYDAGSEQISTQWGVSQTAAYVGITTHTIRFGIAPMILAPFSELSGPKPVFVVTGILFCVSQLSCAVTGRSPGCSWPGFL